MYPDNYVADGNFQVEIPIMSNNCREVQRMLERQQGTRLKILKIADLQAHTFLPKEDNCAIQGLEL